MPQDPKSYFLQSPHGGNTLQPVKKSDIRIPKPPKAPEKPLMPYMRYSRKVWEQVKNSNPHLKLWEVGKIIGQMWRELPDDEKALYVEEYDAEKTQYTELLRQYHSSPAYQAWLVAKERAEKSMEEQDQERKQANARARERAGELAQSDLRESYILEDNEEDTEDQYTAKHVAAARFHRNHRLMQDILSDARLPDPGQLITQNRLNTLRLQVEQLKNHKRNLCQEIESCEARHRAKIQRIRDDSERFRSEYQKVTSSRPVITESQFADMIVKTKQDMQREEEERRSRFQAELEMRRRRQQQRQMEAEAESERRRQLLHQQQLQQAAARASTQHEVNTPYPDRPLERLIMQDKREEAAQPAKLNSVPPQLSTIGKPASASIDVANQESNPPYSPSVTSSLPPTIPSPTGHKLAQAGHTQHHYPPPPNYPPNALSPASVTVTPHQRTQTPLIPQVPPVNVAKPNPSPVGRAKKVPSSASSTSSGSSASSTSSKKKKSDISEPLKDKVNEMVAANNGAQEVRERRISGSAEFTQDQSKVDFPAASAQVGDFHQSMQQRQLINSQIYQQPPAPPPQAGPPPNATVSSHNLGPVPSTPYAYEQALPNAPISGAPASGYYHPPGPMSHANPHSTYPSHNRPPFSQHPGYNVMQYAPLPQQGHSSEHPPPPPPMYIQHMPQQPHVPQNGPPMVGTSQHPPGHLPPQSQQNPPGGWHQAGPAGYAAHYGPSRYPTPNAPVGYPPQAMRHFASNPGYPVPHHSGMQHGGQQHPHHPIPPPASLQEPSGNSQIPAPPPYQQQQQQPGSPMGYWAPHQVPSEYVSGQPPSHPYVSGPQSDQLNIPPQQTPASMESMHPGSTISASAPSDGNMVPMTAQQTQSTNMYYSGGPPPSYGHPSGMNTSGFYPMPHHYPGPHPSNVHGPWSGYPPNVGPPHPPAYQSPQPHQHQQQPYVPSGAFPNSQMQPPKPDQIGSSVAGMDNTQGIPPISNPSSSPVSTNN